MARQKKYLVSTAQMHRHNRIPLLLGHGGERAVSQDTGIRYKDVHASE